MSRANRTPNVHEHEPGAGPSELRTKGRRLTQQRQQIWEAFAAAPEQHLSAEDVVELVRERLPRVNPSTVYRTLDLLVAEGLLLRTDLGGNRAYFEAAHEHAHHHLVCESCGAVQHFHDEDLGDLRDTIKNRTGFAVGSTEITLFGRCRACRRRA